MQTKQCYCREYKMSFTFNFTKEHMSLLIPGNSNPERWHGALCEILPKYQITNERRVAHFISQCAHESNNFRTLEENLNYSADVLLRVFPRYFGSGRRSAAEYARNPEKLANYVYMDEFRTPRARMGNTQPGDGWRFRGRGLKQLTGRNNYAAFGRTVGMTAEQATDYVSTEKGAIESACWFWNSNNLNFIADTDNVVEMTRRINGGDIGLTDRQQRYNRAIQLFRNSPRPTIIPTANLNETVRIGSSGNTVRAVQAKLGLKADGAFGPATDRALREWQLKNGLRVDGIAGPVTLARLLGV
jgi:putative chitinase